MVTFSTSRGSPSAAISVPGSLLQHAAGPQIPPNSRHPTYKEPQSPIAQWAEARFRPHQAKARPPRPTSSTPTKMVSSPGSPKPGPSPLETAAAWVGLVDLVIGLFQFDSVDGRAVDGVALWALVAASLDACPAGSLVSGAMVGTGAGAGSAGGGAGGAGAGGAVGSSEVGLGRGVRGSFGSGSDRPGRQISPHVGVGSDVSAFAGATTQRPIESAKTEAAAVADTTLSADGFCFIDTFSTARGPLRASLVSRQSATTAPWSLLQHAVKH